MQVSARGPATRSRRKPPTRYHHGDLRRALLEEAVRTIAQDGVDALTLREVGLRLGVSRTALYRHFTSKTALLAAVARDGFQRFTAQLATTIDGQGLSPAALRRIGLAYLEFALANPSHYRIMFGNFRELCEQDPALVIEARASFQIMVDAVAALQRAHVLREGNPEHITRQLWVMVHGIAMLTIDGHLGKDARESARELVDFGHLEQPGPGDSSRKTSPTSVAEVRGRA